MLKLVEIAYQCTLISWINLATKSTKTCIQRIVIKQQYLRASSGSDLYGLWTFFVFFLLIVVLVRYTSSRPVDHFYGLLVFRFAGIKVSFGSIVSKVRFSGFSQRYKMSLEEYVSFSSLPLFRNNLTSNQHFCWTEL